MYLFDGDHLLHICSHLTNNTVGMLSRTCHQLRNTLRTSNNNLVRFMLERLVREKILKYDTSCPRISLCHIKCDKWFTKYMKVKDLTYINNLFVHNGKYRDGVDIQIAIASGVVPFMGYLRSLELSVKKLFYEATASLLNHLRIEDVGDLAYIATSRGNFQMLQILLHSGPISPSGKIACLLTAANKGRLHMIELLLTVGKPIYDNNIFVDMLFAATGSGNSKLVRKLCYSSSIVDMPIGYGCKLLLRAIEYCAHNGILKEILSNIQLTNEEWLKCLYESTQVPRMEEFLLKDPRVHGKGLLYGTKHN